MTRSGFTVNIAPRSVPRRLSQEEDCPHDVSGLPQLLARDVRATGHSSQFGSFEKWVMTRCSHLQRETAGSLSHGVPFTFVFVPTSSTRIGWSTSAFLSAIEVFPPIRSLSQRAGLLRCAVAFLVLESTTSSVRCRLLGLGVNDVQHPWSALPLSQINVRLGIVSVSLHLRVQTEFTFVSLSVISSLTRGSCSENNECDRATQGRRVQRHPIRHTYAKQRAAKKKRYWQISTWSTKCLSLVTSCTFPVVHRDRPVHSVDVVVTPDA